MASVDDRIVRMEFDNASFERKLASTLASLGHLDKALKMTGATKGLTDVNDAASKLNMGTITAGIENVSKGFIALSTIAITALSQITAKALMAGAHVAKAFTLTPIIEGFREYETQLNSVQTILANTASKGTTLDQVNDALQRLNTYSDQTIYNFGQMARNIGTFTAAGVDLETSVSSIKGIANLAAMSGSTSEQASTAMYQLSQAIAAGSLKLMDWNSVVNAGMGGEAFKSALFETQKVMGNVLNVPVDQTFAQWEDAGNSFRETLQDGWITADVLTTTLSAFTGDMTEEMLLQKGFSEQQAASILKTAAIAKAAATEVKTFTQLMGTVKEAVGTGFADSFKIIIGNFNEAKTLWTDVNNAIGGFVSKQSDARNAILQGWKDFGGRTELINTLKLAFHNLGLVITTIKEAFTNIFPPVTSATLIKLTASFREFVESLTPTQNTLNNIRSVFQGFFAALSIGWTILKEGVKFIVGIGKALLGMIAPSAVSFVVKLSEGLIRLQDSLVEGGKIKAFFDALTQAMQKPLAIIAKVKDAIGNIFSLFDRSAANAVEDGMGRIGDRFDSLKRIFSAAGNLWEPFENALRKIVDVLDRIWDVIRDWFKELGKKMADVMGEGDFSAVLDAVNTGLLGGIALLIAKFLKGGINFDLGGGFLDKIGQSLDQLTGVLKGMQLNLKADALLKIAGAIGILTASVVALSLIDSVALTRALTAMAVGFGELMGTFALFTKIVSGPMGAATFTIISVGLILLATSMLILSAAILILSTMDWDELARGLTGLAGSLGIIVAAIRLMPPDAEMISTGIGIAALGAGMLVLSVAMKVLATMSWEEMAQGLVGVAGGLGAIVAAMQLMPKDAKLISTGVAVLILAGAMLLLSASIKIFGKMDMEQLAQGLIAVGLSLAGIAGAMHLMPPGMAGTAASLVLVATALLGIATTMKIIAGMKTNQIVKSLTVIAVALGILIGTMYAITGAIAGAATLVIITAALAGFAIVLKMYASMKIMDIVKGLGAIAAVLGLLALAAWALSESIPVLLLFGAALALIGLGIAGVGAGVFLLAKGFKILADAAVSLGKSLPEVLEAIGKALPALIKGLAEGIVELALVFVKAAPVFAKLIGVLIDHIIDTLIILIPKLEIILNQLIDAFIRIVNEKAEPLIAAGMLLLTKFLEGVRANIGNLVTLVGDIIVAFLEAFRLQIPRVVSELGAIIVEIFTSVAYNLGLIAGTLLLGVGIAFLTGLKDGIEQYVPIIKQWWNEFPGKVLEWIGDTLSTLWQKGVDFLQGVKNGIEAKVGEIIGWFGALPGNVFSWVGDALGALWQKGVDLLQGLINGLQAKVGEIQSWVSGLPGTISGYFSGAINWLVSAGNDVMQGFWNGLKAIWQDIKSWISNKVEEAKNLLTHPWDVLSPSKFTRRLGENIMEGWHIGLKEGWKDVDNFLSNLNATDSIDQGFVNNMSNILSNVADQMSTMEEFSPTITPVLDLTEVASEASKIGGYIQESQNIVPTFSVDQARVIARQQAERQAVPIDFSQPNGTNGGINFTQINNSPSQLSTSDIYKQTRNQIRIAKEELSIP